MATSKTVVITGANSGIGRATAQILASKGYNIITICRKEAEGVKIADELRRTNASITAENFTVDLSDLKRVENTAKAIRKKYPVIDRLINNAGYYPPAIEYVGEVEKSFLASHVGHMLLTELLLPSLKQSTESRIINVSSTLHQNGSVSRFFKRTPGHNPSKAYGDDKLANILFTMSLVKHLPSNVTAYSLHPGVVNSNFGNTVTGGLKVLITLFSVFFITLEKGAATSVYLTDAPFEEVKPYNGKYFDKKKPVATSNKDVTDVNAALLWDKSNEILRDYLAAGNG
jgi:retinol dehydrogenase 12